MDRVLALVSALLILQRRKAPFPTKHARTFITASHRKLILGRTGGGHAFAALHTSSRPRRR